MYRSVANVVIIYMAAVCLSLAHTSPQLNLFSSFTEPFNYNTHKTTGF